MTEQVPNEPQRLEIFGWLVRARWIAVLSIGAATGLGWLLYPGQIPLLLLGGVALIMALYNFWFLSYSRSLHLSAGGTDQDRQIVRQLGAQLVLDLGVLAALVHLSGGAESPASLFLALPVVIAGMVLSERSSLLLASLAILLYVIIIALEYLVLLPHHHPPVLDSVEMFQQTRYLLTAAAMLVVLLGLAAYLTSSISASLRRGELELRYRLELALIECQELEEINSRLQRLDSERTRFLTTVTHELRAPINTIHTCVELALAGHASPEKVREILERVKARTAELSDLIGDLLRLARAREEASRDERIELVQPVDVLQSVVQLMRTEASSNDLFLSTDIEPDLAPIQANAERLKLVWTNLLSNAIKYTEPGGIVGVTLKQTPEQLVGTVRDTGIGIPPEDLQRIFEEFYRAENARAMSPVGTGVGLAIVRRIIETWGGKISVESEPGLGSKFTLVLPRADV